MRPMALMKIFTVLPLITLYYSINTLYIFCFDFASPPDLNNLQNKSLSLLDFHIQQNKSFYQPGLDIL